MKNIFVYGGCVSRDVFNAPYNKGELNLATYIARYSLAKLGSQRVPIKIDPDVLPSPFQRRMVEIDARNNLLSYVKLREYDYLLMDFLFTRFSLVQVRSGLLTYSEELKKTKLITSKNQVIRPDDIVYWEHLTQGIKLFIEYLHSIDSLEKLLINKVYLAEKDSDNNGFDNISTIKQQNDLLDRIYRFLGGFINSSQILESDSSLLIAAVEHQWGRSPMHYIPDFYNNLYNKITTL